MKHWEDIIKDKLGEPDGALPESVFDEFHARFDGAEGTRTARRFPLVWAIVPAIAAGKADGHVLLDLNKEEDNYMVEISRIFLIFFSEVEWAEDSNRIFKKVQKKIILKILMFYS